MTREPTRPVPPHNAPPDGDRRTLHVRCGSDIAEGLRQGGFSGDFLEYSDPICQGPVSDGPDALARRAGFIASGYPGQDAAHVLARLEEENRRLDAAGDYPRIVLWFEHDSYDQLLLAKVLHRLHMNGVAADRVEIVTCDRFPGIEPFIGLGQLSPQDLRHAYAGRQPVAPAAWPLAKRAWQALTASEPAELNTLAHSPSDALPYLARAVRRHLAELPDLRTGLSLTEHHALDLLRDGPLPWGQVFARFMRDRDPLPYHGDLMFLGDLLRMTRAAEPALAIDGEAMSSAAWGSATVTLTETGRAVLAGRRDWRDCGPEERHVGGLRCFGAPDWRFAPGQEIAVAAEGAV